MLALLSASQERPRYREDGELRARIDELKAKTDLREYLRPVLKNHREFEGYWLASCLAPDHADNKMSLLVHQNGCSCMACGWKADILDIYRAEHPEERLTDAIAALMADPTIKCTGELKTRELRGIDQDLATRYHLALIDHPEALAGLEGMGFTRAAIQHFQLGIAQVPVRLENDTFEEQWRFSVPVFRGSHIVQIIYRKSNTNDRGPKVTQEKGAGTWLYNQDVLEKAERAIYAEGWGDAIVFWQVGIPAVTSTAGAGHFNEAWCDLLGHSKRLYVVGDADSAGQRMMERVKSRLPWARPLKLPWALGSKEDVRDLWLSGWRKPEFEKWLRAADMEANWKALKRGH